MKKQLLLLLTLCVALSVVAQPYSRPKLPIVRTTQKDGKYGLTDNNGKCLVANVLDQIKTYYYREYLIAVKYNKEYFIIDRKGSIVANAGRTVPLSFNQFVVINHNTAIDANGKELFPGQSVSPITLIHGDNHFYLFVNKPKNDKNDRYQLVTINNEVVSGELNGFFTASISGTIIFKNYQEDKCGVLNSLGDVLVPCKYSSVEFFSFNDLKYECKLDKTKLLKLYNSKLHFSIGLFVAQRGGYYTLYDQSGTQLTKPKMYKNASEAIKKNFKKAALPHFMRRGYVMQSIQEKINNPNRIRYEEYIAAANRLPIFSSSNKSLSSHIAYLEQHPNFSDYTLAECYEKGKKLYDDDKYQQAIPWLLRAAEGKHTPAYRRLADSYNNSKQFQKAHSWYKKCVK
ncbi:MAG: sel1 repeat family protein, partial [Alistipes sp.]|nr:sel1 repeat family protein [Alistipes sp.]